LNFSEIAAEDDKDNDEDKASLPDTEVGEVEDFSQQQLADIEAENEDEDEEEPESKKPKYSAVVKKRTRPKVNSVLYIQAGEKDRAPIEKGCFETFWKVANREIAKMVWENQWEPHAKKGIRFPWKFWSKGAGIIGCQNKESEEFLLELTKTIKWPGATFRAWRQGEYGYSTLVTMVLPPDTLDIFKQEEVIPLILQQNGLTGAHSAPRFKTKPKGVTLITMGVAPEMIPLIRALGGKGSCGACPVKINVKKEEDSEKAAKEAETTKETTTDNAEKNGEEETPETADKQEETAMDTTVREDKKDTTVRENKMDTTVEGDKMDTVQDELDPTNW